MAKVTGSGEVKEFMGRVLDESIKYSYEYETFGNKNDAIAAGKWPSDADEYVLTKVNKAQETAAKAKAYQAAIASEREAYEQTPAFKVKQIVDSLTAAGMPLTDATKLADSIVAK